MNKNQHQDLLETIRHAEGLLRSVQLREDSDAASRVWSAVQSLQRAMNMLNNVEPTQDNS